MEEDPRTFEFQCGWGVEWEFWDRENQQAGWSIGSKHKGAWVQNTEALEFWSTSKIEEKDVVGEEGVTVQWTETNRDDLDSVTLSQGASVF